MRGTPAVVGLLAALSSAHAQDYGSGDDSGSGEDITTTSTACSPVSLYGFYPLYDSRECAIAHPGGDGTYHTHTFPEVDSLVRYMPNGVPFWHGDYNTGETTVNTPASTTSIQTTTTTQRRTTTTVNQDTNENQLDLGTALAIAFGTIGGVLILMGSSILIVQYFHKRNGYERLTST